MIGYLDSRRRDAAAGVSKGCALTAAVVISIVGLCQSAHADWIDTKTGARVGSFPVVTDSNGKTDWIRPDVGDRNRAFDPRTGRNFARNECGDWIDTKTGARVASFPVVTDSKGKTDWIRPDIGDRNRAFDPRTGRNFARESCAPSTAGAQPSSPTASTTTPAGAQAAPASPVIPAPPGNAQQDLQQSDHAFDPATGHNLAWDAGRKSWIDTQTGQTLGFQGAIAKDGTVIPAPAPSVAKSGGKSQAKQDPSAPERAYNAITGQTLVWNRAESAWIDTRSQKNVGFQGAFAPGTAPPGGGPGASPALGMMYGAAIAAGSDRREGGKDDKRTGTGDDRDRGGGGGVTIPFVIPISPSPPQPSTALSNPPPPVQPSGGHTVERQPPPPTQTAVAPPPAATTPASPDEAVCGPIVTDKVFATLKKITRDFDARPGEKAMACHNLYGPTTYEDAWDIIGLDPGTSPGASEDPGYRGDPNRTRRAGPPQATWNQQQSQWIRSDGHRFDPWLTGASKACAIPRPDDACAATVQFMGTCQHAQVVNYVMWGRVNKLCGYPLSDARGAIQIRSFFGDDEMRQRQLDMTNIGYVTTNPEDIQTGFLTTPSKFQKCQLKCPIKLNATPWGYRWIGFNAE